MNKNLWQNLKDQLTPYALTSDEKARIRSTLQSQMLKRPRSRFSPYLNIFLMRPAVGVLVVVLVVFGGGAGLSFASASSLPNQILYPVKILSEEITVWSKSNSADKAKYEIERVDKRFAEAAQLAKMNQLESGVREKIAEKLSEHIASIKTSTTEIEKTNPNIALETSTKLGVSLETNSRALASVVGDEVANPILAVADTSVKQIAKDKSAVVQAVTINKDSATKTQAVEKLAKLRIEVASLTSLVDTDSKNESTVPTPTPSEESIPENASVETLAMTTTSGATAVAGTEISAKALSITATTSIEILNEINTDQTEDQKTDKTETLSPSESASKEIQKSFITDLSSLLEEADAKMATGEYGAALVILDKVEALIETQKKISSLEDTLDIEISEKIIDIPEDKTSMIDTETEEKAQAERETSSLSETAKNEPEKKVGLSNTLPADILAQ